MTSESDNHRQRAGAGELPADGAMRAQYETLPYPARDPADEKKRLVTGSPSHILEIDHYLFAGRRDWRRPFRALIAGGGTGDAAIMLAQQLADAGTPAELHYLDLSKASRSIAEARASIRGLDNLRFHTASLLDLPTLGLGRFDYIDCCGVLHHLADPAAGLAALADAMANDGGMGIMVYGALGRTGVYPLQDMLRQIAPAARPPTERLSLARKLLAQLPATNWFKRNPYVGDHLQGGDAGLFDLLLHSRDRAYRVGELAATIEGQGLAIAGFIEPARYDPATYINDPALLRSLAPLSPVERAQFAEALAGNITKHVVYAARRARVPECVAVPDTGSVVPVLRDGDGARLAESVRAGGMLRADLDGFAWQAALPRLAGPILTRIDGKRDLAAIHAELQALDSRLGWETFKRQFDQLYGVFNAANRLLLRCPPAA